jgi:hypothetical protein
MNRLLKFGLTILVASPLLASLSALADTPPAAPPPADVTGSWIMKIRSPRGTQEPVLKLEKAGDKYVGAMTSPQGQATPIKDIEYKDGQLSFQVVGERQGQKFALEYTAKISGEKIQGKMTVKGRNFSMPFEGHRESPIEGVWKLAFTLEDGKKMQPTIHVKQVGDKFTGDYVGITGKKFSAKDVKFKEGELTFDTQDEADHEILFHYTGKMTGDKLKGTVAWVGDGNQKKSLALDGEKSKKQTADVNGTWKLKVATKDGSTFEPTLKLVQTGGAVSGTYTGEQGDTPLTDALVLGDEFTFEVTRQKDGKVYKLRYQGKVNGDTLKGNVDYNFDGISGFVDFEGKRTTPGATVKP